MLVHIAMDFFGPGAVAKRARQEVAMLVSAGYDVAVITAQPRKKDLETSFLDGLSGGKIQLIYVSTALEMRFRKFLNAAPELLLTARCYEALARLNNNESIELIVTHAATPSYAIVRFNRRQKKKIPTAYVVHALIWDRIDGSANPHNWIDTHLYKHADRYALAEIDYSVCVSDYIRNLAIAKGANPERALVFYNPIDTTIFKRDSSLSLKDIDVLFVGRLSPEKGLETLMEAAQYLSKETRIVIIGDGELYKQLERQVEQLACNIELKGWVNNQSLPIYYNRSKVFVVPSLSEPQGVVVLEAMACGVPVIASNTGGLPEMIEHGKNGWLVEPGDAKSLANTIQAALSDEIVRINAGDSALETAQSFSTEWFRQQLPCFYKQMLEAN